MPRSRPRRRPAPQRVAPSKQFASHGSDRTRAVAEAIGDVVRSLGPEVYTQSWCVEATRLVVLIAAKFRLRAEPIEVATVVANAAEVHSVRVPNPLPHYDDQRPVMVATGFGPENRTHQPGSFDGHLVALVEGRYVVDLAIAQNRRPPFGISTPDVCVLHAPWLRKDDGEFAGAIVEGYGPASLIAYKRRPLCVDLNIFEAWEPSHLRDLAGAIAELVRARLAGRRIATRTEICRHANGPMEAYPEWQYTVSRSLLVNLFDAAQRTEAIRHGHFQRC
jgi:hypothetical protein